MIRPLATLLAAVLLFAACSDDEPATEPEAATPEQVVETWLGALADTDLAGLDATTETTGVALVAGAENAFSVEQMQAVVDSGLPPATLRSYWSSFGESFSAFLGGDLAEITVAGSEAFAVEDVAFAAVTVTWLGEESAIIVKQTQSGWVVDMVATVGPALSVQIRRLVETIVREGDDAVAFTYATVAVESLGAGLARQPDNRALELELEAIEDLPIDLSR